MKSTPYEALKNVQLNFKDEDYNTGDSLSDSFVCQKTPFRVMYLREPIVSKALERKLREWTIVNTLEALDSKFILTKALTKL